MKKTALILSLSACAMGSAFRRGPRDHRLEQGPGEHRDAVLSRPVFLRVAAQRPQEGQGREGRSGRSGLRALPRRRRAGDGRRIVKGGPLEPTPVRGKHGHIDLKVQAAYDDKNAYLRFQWRTNADRAGTAYPSYRFDGKEWKSYGGPKLDKEVQDGTEPGIYEDRMSLMIDDGKVPGFARQGCWLTCHDGSRDMPGSSARTTSKANALLTAIKKDDVRKYLPATRTDPSDWKTGKPVDEIAKIKAAGGFVDLIQWRAHRRTRSAWPTTATCSSFAISIPARTCSAATPTRGRTRRASCGTRRRPGTSRYGEHCARATTSWSASRTRVPFDPSAGWKEGDMLPDYFLSREDAKGSAADNKAIARLEGREWTVVISRPLGLANDDDKALREGGVYNVGFAVHDDNITTRGHHVSFVRTLGSAPRPISRRSSSMNGQDPHRLLDH